MRKTIAERVLTPAQEEALARLKSAMEKGWPLDVLPIDRDAIHARRGNDRD